MVLDLQNELRGSSGLSIAKQAGSKELVQFLEQGEVNAAVAKWMVEEVDLWPVRVEKL